MKAKSISPFGLKLEAAMKSKDINGATLARKLKIHQPQVHALKRVKNPTKETLQKLSAVLGKSLKYWGSAESVKVSSTDIMAYKASKQSAKNQANSKNNMSVYIVIMKGNTEISRKRLS